MLIMSRIRQKVKKQILPYVPGKLKRLFEFGINSLSLVPYQSLNQNARVYGGGQSIKADLMRVFRLTRNKKLTWYFYQLLTNLGKINSDLKINNDSFINVDITEFLPFAVLCLSLQTHCGRGVPVFISIIKYPVAKERSQNIFIADTLRKFLILINTGRSGKPVIPKIVLDRGFMGEYLVNEFSRLGFTFYLRVKKTISDTHVSNKQSHDATINYHGLNLRLVRSSRKQQKQAQSKQAWYILTNDLTSPRPVIINIYYHRFEIEEFFKDLKHLFNTKRCFIKHSLTLLIIIWFQILGVWLLYSVKPPPIVPLFTINPHHRLSWFKQTWECVQRELFAPVILPVLIT